MSNTVKIGWRNVAYNEFTGKVAETSKRTETKITGSGGGGFTYQGTGTTTPINISSETIVHDQIFLVDKLGNEKAIQLSGFNLACRAGHIVTVIWLVVEGAPMGGQIAFVNHSTNQNYFNNTQINRIARFCAFPFSFDASKLIPVLIFIVVFFVLWFISYKIVLFGLLPLMLYATFGAGKQNMKKIEENIKIPSVQLW